MACRLVYVMGYQPHNGIPLEDYGDFKPGTKFTLEEVDRMTDQGVFPPGTILQMKDGKPCIIKGDYNTIQHVEELQPCVT